MHHVDHSSHLHHIYTQIHHFCCFCLKDFWSVLLQFWSTKHTMSHFFSTAMPFTPKWLFSSRRQILAVCLCLWWHVAQKWQFLRLDEMALKVVIFSMCISLKLFFSCTKVWPEFQKARPPPKFSKVATFLQKIRHNIHAICFIRDKNKSHFFAVP